MTAQKSRITYNDVVATLPHLDPEEQLNLLQVLTSVLKKAVTPKKAKKKHNLLELEGLGAETWAKVDVDEYIRKERGSWD